MDRAQACGGEDGQGRLGHHRHVDDDAIAALDAKRLHHRRGAVHFGVQLAVGEAARLVDLGRDPHQRLLLGTHAEVPVEGIVAKVGLSADEPAGERRSGIVEHLLVGPVPVDERGLLPPEGLAIGERTPMELAIGRHRTSVTPRSSAA